MNYRVVQGVFRKELKETLRDRRTLLIMLVVPVFLYPALMVIVQQLALFGQRQLEEAPVEVVAQGAVPGVLARLEADSGLTLTRDDTVTPEAVREGRIDLLLTFEEGDRSSGGGAGVALHFDPSRDRSRLARDLTVEHLEEWSDSVLAERVAARGLPPSFLQPLPITQTSVATPERMGGYALGRFLPMLLILMTLLGAFYPAIDLSAGEKERGTLETLLTTPVPAREIVAGKFLTVGMIALAAASLNLASMLLTFQFAAMQLEEAVDITLRLPAETILLVILFLVPLAVFFSALFLGLALRAQSFKEAQNTLTPVQLASMIPMMLPLIPGISLTYAVAMVPIGGVALLFRELMTGDPPMGPSVVALVATIAYATMALRFAARSFGREEVLFGASGASTPTGGARQLLADWRTKGRRQPEPAEALAFVAVVALLYFYLGTSIQLRLGETGILLSQVTLMAIPALLFVGLGGYGSERGLAFRRPSGRALGGAVLVIVGGIPIAWLLGWIQSLFMEIPTEFLEAFEELVRAETAGEIAWLVLIVALTPAICEELVFRGVLLQGLSSRMTMTRAVGTSAVIFGLFHLSVETAIRFLPSAWLGLVLGYVVWHTRSIVTSMVMHFINNGFIVLVLAYPQMESEIAGPNGEPRWYLVAGGLLLFFVGLRVLPRRDPEPEAIPEWPV